MIFAFLLLAAVMMLLYTNPFEASWRILSGGHGALNILPQKRWNVYRRDNRLIVEKDKLRYQKQEELMTAEAEAEEMLERYEQLLKRKKSLASESEIVHADPKHLETLRQSVDQHENIMLKENTDPSNNAIIAKGEENSSRTTRAIHKRRSVESANMQRYNNTNNSAAFLEDWSVPYGPGNKNVANRRVWEERACVTNGAKFGKEKRDRNFYLPGLVPVLGSRSRESRGRELDIEFHSNGKSIIDAVAKEESARYKDKNLAATSSLLPSHCCLIWE